MGFESWSLRKKSVESQTRVSPDPPTLAFLEKKARETPKKARVLLFAEPLKSLEKRKKRTKKQGKSENEKSKEIEKSKDWRVRV